MAVRASLDATEVSPLASELAHAYAFMARFYRDQMEMSGAEASARARGADDTPEAAAGDLERIRARPPDQVSWFELNRLADRNPDALATVFRDIRAAARDELASGHRTARALDWDGNPWQRARFLAIRDTFRADYDPRPGIESALVDLAAEAFGDYLEWTEAVHRQGSTELERERSHLERHGKRQPRHVWINEIMAESAGMADRAHARFLRTVAALEGMRRAANVSVQYLTIAQEAIIVAPSRDRQS